MIGAKSSSINDHPFQIVKKGSARAALHYLYSIARLRFVNSANAPLNNFSADFSNQAAAGG